MRYPELDIARGAAVIAMIAYHAVFDIFYFKTGTAPYVGAAIVIASTFIFISGICAHISWHRYKGIKKTLWRSAKLAAAALTITAVSFLLLKGGWIVFGILHFFAVVGLVSIPLLLLRNRWLLAIAIVAFALGTFVNTNPYLLWLLPTSFATFDYFPLVPWLGVYALGICFGRIVYKNGKRSFAWHFRSKALEWVGRHSLLIYFLHQPIILAALVLLGFTAPLGIIA